MKLIIKFLQVINYYKIEEKTISIGNKKIIYN